MIYEVEVKVKISDGRHGDQIRSVRQTYNFGDNEKWALAGAAYAIDQTADYLVNRLMDEVGASDLHAKLNDVSGKPRRN